MPEIKKLRLGDSAVFTVSYPKYPASDGWTLDYVIAGGGGKTGLVATAAGNDFKVVLSHSFTGQLSVGAARLVGRISKGDERFTIYDEPIIIHPNLMEGGAGFDVRTAAQRGLDNISAVLEKRATKDQDNYSINGRSLGRTPIESLIILKDHYRQEVAREKRAARFTNGRLMPRVLMRFK
jgi:hypothetical protein